VVVEPARVEIEELVPGAVVGIELAQATRPGTHLERHDPLRTDFCRAAPCPPGATTGLEIGTIDRSE